MQDGIDAIRDVVYHVETFDVTTVRASTPMFLMSRKIKAMGVKMVLSGEGSDEVFGGYLYFHKAPSKVRRKAVWAAYMFPASNKEGRGGTLGPSAVQSLQPFHPGAQQRAEMQQMEVRAVNACRQSTSLKHTSIVMSASTPCCVVSIVVSLHRRCPMLQAPTSCESTAILRALEEGCYKFSGACGIGQCLINQLPQRQWHKQSVWVKFDEHSWKAPRSGSSVTGSRRTARKRRRKWRPPGTKETHDALELTRAWHSN
eukprot:1157514-Pelagomonas_calceolata.AAC.9